MAANVPNQELTTAEKEVLRLMREYETEHGAPPSLRWLAEKRGVTHAAIALTKKSLARKGYLREKKITFTRIALGVTAKGKKQEL